MALVQ